ncbi:13989_t:CDS:10 [Ambispora leptoticha]|uniref:13989_t:CDS:1 n=1 Tax=Ambispora leptoticha TaxID=144679 RepID=A0A9N9A264_9GLOM|nr:13989_t:CDS:10 [Ambispora leptoticha]
MLHVRPTYTLQRSDRYKQKTHFNVQTTKLTTADYIMIFSALRNRRNNNVCLISLIIISAIFAVVTTVESSNNIIKKDIDSLITPRALYLPQAKRSPLEDSPNKECPPCFDCHLSIFECSHFANCSDFDGKCQCPPGFGGEDCSKPLCNSLADGSNRRTRGDNQVCECAEGWTGINCNVCHSDFACDPLVPTGMNGTCYKGGLTVNENFQMCDVTNRKILDMLPDQPPQVTFSCNRPDETCDFQFWINQTESFYCHLDECAFSLDVTYDKNITEYNCKNIKCKCREGEMLCGKDGSIDLSEWLVEEIKGPGDFKCYNSEDYHFISLKCGGGECLHYTQVPGFVRPPKPENSKMIIASIVAVLVFVIGVFHLSRNWKTSDNYGLIQLPDDESSKLMADHVPATLLFQDISYYVGEKQVLNSIHGIVHPAKRNKAGIVSGDIYVNGRVVEDRVYKSVVGYVDQEDHLLPTLTVYETILYSALLRLPREMSLEAKKFRVIETMSELGILEIKDSKIGESGARSISGGEKRRVSIACELVTSPSILFLDEPTSGLDAYNAYNVVECLVTLARNYNRTVVCTIHQPRSNIFALFDQLLLLAEGHMVYSGEASKCQEYFESIGHKCPPGFNIADYLVDLTMYAVKPRDEEIVDDLPEGTSTAISTSPANATNDGPESTPVSRFAANNRPPLRNRASIHDIQDLQLYAPQPPSNQHEQENSPLLELNDRSRPGSTDDIGLDVETEGMSEHLRMLVERYRRSLVALQVKDEIDRTVNRNPMLMLTHYCISVYLAILCGALYYKVTNDIAGFQNRMGVLFFMCALFGFGCLSSIHIFASERILFVKERANGYYAPITYFASKVIFDIIPLRVVPPILMGVIIYHMVGLVNGTSEFCKFILVLVLFNLTAASICLCIGIIFKEVGVASLLSSLIMLFSMLFGGLFLNKDSIPEYLAWLKNLSFFNYAFEALLVNEVVYLQLTEQKFGLSIDVPGATILTTFGFDASAYWTDVLKLTTLFVSALVLSFLCLQFFVKEKR